MNVSSSCRAESLPPIQNDDVLLKQRPATITSRKRSVGSDDGACDTRQRPQPVKRTKSLPTKLLPEQSGKPLFWFLAKDHHDHSMMLSASTFTETNETTSVSEGTTYDISLLQNWKQDDSETMELSYALSFTSSNSSFLDASDALLGLHFVTQDDADDV